MCMLNPFLGPPKSDSWKLSSWQACCAPVALNVHPVQRDISLIFSQQRRSVDYDSSKGC